MTSRFENDVDRLLSAESDDEIYEVGAELVSALSRSPALLYALDDERRLALRSTRAADVNEYYRSMPLAAQLLDQTAHLERSVRIDDCADTRSAAVADPASTTYRSALLVPIPEQGLILMAAEAPDAFDDDDLEKVELVAQVLGAALRDAERPRDASTADERLETIRSILSHDLASPMAVARAYLEDAIETDETENLENVLLAIDRIDEITSGLELFARTGSSIDSLEPVDFAEAAEMGWSMVETADATLETAGTETILADEHRLYQLFENLFANAVQHGGSSATVRVGVLTDGSGFLVEDDGPGVPPEQREVIFDHGYSSTDEHSGFGLSIVSGIVDAHGWEIRVVDGTDGGARFEVTGVTVA